MVLISSTQLLPLVKKFTKELCDLTAVKPILLKSEPTKNILQIVAKKQGLFTPHYIVSESKNWS